MKTELVVCVCDFTLSSKSWQCCSELEYLDVHARDSCEELIAVVQR